MGYYRKPKRETILKNRQFYKDNFKQEIKWLNKNVESFKGDKFLVDMHHILLSGSRKMTPKMIEAVRKAMVNPRYDVVKRLERKEKIKPIMEKVKLVYDMVQKLDSDKSAYYKDNYSALGFVTSLMKQLEDRMSLSEKQMRALNKVFKRYNDRLEKKLKKSEKKA